MDPLPHRRARTHQYCTAVSEEVDRPEQTHVEFPEARAGNDEGFGQWNLRLFEASRIGRDASEFGPDACARLVDRSELEQRMRTMHDLHKASNDL